MLLSDYSEKALYKYPVTLHKDNRQNYKSDTKKVKQTVKWTNGQRQRQSNNVHGNLFNKNARYRV